jgi:FtsP/CotA-like multicopper oxidase with cupredoxin domain
MNKIIERRGGLLIGLMTVLLLWGVQAQAVIDGIEGTTANLVTTFNLAAKQDNISTPDADSILMWGYADADGTNRMQYPGPTLIVDQGVTVTVNLTNELPAAHLQNVSIVFPGHAVTASGGVAGALTREAGYVGNPGADPTTVTYTFLATHPGTYLYRSGTRPDLQAEMGLVGALIVRPAGNPTLPDDRPHSPDLTLAYNHPDTAYHHEYLYLVTEVDVNIHALVRDGRIAEVDMTTWFPVHWFVNGRAFPDLLQMPYHPFFPTQPYNCVPRTHPFEKVLIRVIGAGRQLHPMHYHGADFAVIAANGRMLSSDGGAAGPDLAWQASTINFTPGQTADFLWEWTGADIGWDIYGHAPGDVPEWGYENGCPANPADPNATVCPGADNDHGKPFPVILAERDDLAFGQFYSGSPWLGTPGDLPPDHPGLNSGGAYFFPWHSHSEKELTSNDVFPGGALTFVILEGPTTPIP